MYIPKIITKNNYLSTSIENVIKIFFHIKINTYFISNISENTNK